jgi:ethanolamine phosphate transferase 2 subunit G
MSIIAEATFPLAFSQYSSSEMCQPKPTQDLARLACEWREADQGYHGVQTGNLSALEAMGLTWSFLRDGQEMLSGTASNYDLNAMFIGIGIATIAVVLALLSNPGCYVERALGSCAYSLVTLGYAIIMFASSYVEEEQQFWYWALGGWLVAFYCKE